jgi:hypothetical protein
MTRLEYFQATEVKRRSAGSVRGIPSFETENLRSEVIEAFDPSFSGELAGRLLDF